MIPVVCILAVLGALLMAIVAGALRHLNFSQLQARFEPDEYEALVDSLKRRDDVELVAATAATLFAGIALVTVVILAAGDYRIISAAVLVLGLAIHWLPVVLIAPWAERMLIDVMPLYRLLESLPLTMWLAGQARRLAGTLAREPENEAHNLEMSHLISEGAAEGHVSEAERDMIARIFELNDTDVRDVMTPRTDVIYLHQDDSQQVGLALAAEHGLSRLPIYDPENDQVKGVFFVRDTLKQIAEGSFDPNQAASEIMRQVPVVPETRQIATLMQSMTRSRNQMVVVIDEYGSMAGVVTLEDILEEVVGEIRDEYAVEHEELRSISQGIWEARAGVRIEDLNEDMPGNLPEDDSYETLAGFLLKRVQRIPRRGESFDLEGHRFVILVASERRIERVRIEQLPA